MESVLGSGRCEIRVVTGRPASCVFETQEMEPKKDLDKMLR
jgi:hypothetical protein